MELVITISEIIVLENTDEVNGARLTKISPENESKDVEPVRDSNLENVSENEEVCLNNPRDKVLSLLDSVIYEVKT